MVRAMILARSDESDSYEQHPTSPIATQDRPPAPRNFIRVVLLVLVPILVCGGTAFGVASQMAPVYAAQSDILFDLGDRPDVLEKFLATQAVVARSRAILSPISRSYSIPIATLDDNLSVDFPKGSVVMRLQYADPNADTAFAVLKSIVEGYVRLLNRTEFLKSRTDVLVPAFALDKAVWPKPFQAAAVGIAVGLAIAIAGLALGQHLGRRT